MATLYIMSCLSASGKSHIAESISKRTGALQNKNQYTQNQEILRYFLCRNL